MQTTTKAWSLLLLVLVLGASAFFARMRGAADPAPPSAHGHEHPLPAGQDDAHHAAPVAHALRGAQRGRWFEADGFGLEVTIFEAGVPPEFRIYLYRDGRPLAPGSARVTLELERLGRAPQTIQFVADGDYLRGDALVAEPHSFEVRITATYAERDYHFAYEQVESRVELSDQELARSGIELATAGPARIEQVLRLPGEIRLNGDRLAHVVAPITGVAQSVHANAGEKIERGAVLAVISSQVLAEMRLAAASADARLALAHQAKLREQRLWREGIAPEQDFRRAEYAAREAALAARSAREQIEALGDLAVKADKPGLFELRAPIAGTIIDKHLAVGEGVSPETRVFTVADLSTVWAEAKVGARDLAAVRSGQSARVSALAGEPRADGTVSYLSALLGEQDRAVTARVVLDNPRDAWRPGLPITIDIVTGGTDAAVAVAADALHTLRDWQVVFGRYGEFFEARPLALGARDDRQVEVLDGLTAGERYAVKNSYVIKADIGKAGASHDH